MAEFMEKTVDIMPYLRKLRKRWKFILLIAFVGACLGFVFAKSIPAEFTVVSKISPELSYRTSNLSSIASLAGINTSMLNNTDALLPMIYPDIVASQYFVTNLFDTPVNARNVDTTLYAYMKDYCRKPWWGTVLSLPMKAASGVVKLFKPEAEAPTDSIVDPFHLTKEQAIVAKAINKSIQAEVDKRTFLITIIITMQDPMVAAQVSERVIDELKTFVSDYRTDKARTDLEYYQTMYDDAEKDYYDSMQKYSRYVDTHQGFVLQSVRTEQTRLQNDMNLKFQLFTTVAQQLQNANAKVQQETPVLAVIRPPVVPIRKSSPKTLPIMFVFAVLGFFAGCIIAISSKRK